MDSILLCEAAGYEVIIIETVGVGQSEIAVKNMTDVFLLLMLAGAGDELQGIKRGIMEMADILVINKADGDNVANANLAKKAYENALHTSNPNYSDVVSYAPTIPHQAYMIYQAMFAIITPALISGAIVERVTFRAYFLFVLIWSTVIYCPIAHMVWAKGGFIGLFGGLGALDFAGGTVVHISSGVSALVAAWVIGPRQTYPNQPAPPHNVPFILLGVGLLWFGWFGFNAGSALASGSLATVAFVATNTAAAGAALAWAILEWGLRGKPTAVGIATGAVAGLVGVTPAAGFVTPLGALLIGGIVAFCCFFELRVCFART